VTVTVGGRFLVERPWNGQGHVAGVPGEVQYRLAGVEDSPLACPKCGGLDVQLVERAEPEQVRRAVWGHANAPAERRCATSSSAAVSACAGGGRRRAR